MKDIVNELIKPILSDIINLEAETEMSGDYSSLTETNIKGIIEEALTKGYKKGLEDCKMGEVK